MRMGLAAIAAVRRNSGCAFSRDHAVHRMVADLFTRWLTCSGSHRPLAELGLTVCEKDRPWNALVEVEEHVGLDGEAGIA